jgi:transcription elongation factor Elf1
MLSGGGRRMNPNKKEITMVRRERYSYLCPVCYSESASEIQAKKCCSNAVWQCTNCSCCHPTESEAENCCETKSYSTYIKLSGNEISKLETEFNPHPKHWNLILSIAKDFLDGEKPGRLEIATYKESVLVMSAGFKWDGSKILPLKQIKTEE